MASLVTAETVHHGRTVYAEMVGQGEAHETALSAALMAVIDREREICAGVVRSWSGMTKRDGDAGGSRLVEKIAADVEESA